jgi:hypothetical protein
MWWIMDDQRRVVLLDAVEHLLARLCVQALLASEMRHEPLGIGGVVHAADRVQVAGQVRLGIGMQLQDGGPWLESVLALQRLLLSDPEASVAVQLAQPRRALRPGCPPRQIVLGDQREPSQEAQHREHASHAHSRHPAICSGTVWQKTASRASH